MVVDSGSPVSSFASEVISVVSRLEFFALKQAPQMITSPDVPEPTSHGVIGQFKFDSSTIAEVASRMVGRNVDIEVINQRRTFPSDVPSSDFKGPF